MLLAPSVTDEVTREDLQQQVLNLQAELAIKDEQIASRSAELAQIRALMHTVTVYEGLVDVSPLTMMVSDLVKDHDALETRIENALHYIADMKAGGPMKNLDGVTGLQVDTEHIVHLLRGGSPVPDTIEGLDG